MSDKQEMIKQMLEMQRKFIEYEHEHGVAPPEYWGQTDDKHPLHNYRDSYGDLATKVVDIAHSEKGSKR